MNYIEQYNRARGVHVFTADVKTIPDALCTLIKDQWRLAGSQWAVDGKSTRCRPYECDKQLWSLLSALQSVTYFIISLPRDWWIIHEIVVYGYRCRRMWLGDPRKYHSWPGSKPGRNHGTILLGNMIYDSIQVINRSAEKSHGKHRIMQ